MKYISILLFVLIALNASAKEYHVDTNSSSRGNGSESNPFKTITQAAKVMKAGDICYIHAGTYREMIQPKHSGTENHPIVFKSYNDDIVMISATEAVNGWEKYKGKIYKKSKLDMPMGQGNNVFYNYEKMQIARWPNNTDNDEYTLDAKYIDMTEGTFSMSYISNNEIPDIDWTGGIIHYLGAHSGCSWERTIKNYDKDLHRVFFETLPNKWPFGTTHSPVVLRNGHRGIFYLMNKLEALDAPREWYYDAKNKELYFYTPDGKAPEQGTVEIPVRLNTAILETDYVHIEGLNFFGGMMTITGSHNTVSKCMIKHATERLIVDLNGAAMSDAAIQLLDGHHNTIQKCVLENSTLNGIIISGNATDNLIDNNIVQHFNTIGLHAQLLNSQGERNVITHNSFCGSARDGVKVTGNDSEFAYNHVQRAMISGSDGGLFYVTGNSVARNIELHHNWFHSARSAKHAGYKAAGIYLDNNSAGYIVHHNVVWDTDWGGINFNWDALKNEIYNNTFWNIGKPEQSLINSWIPMSRHKGHQGERTNVRENKIYNNLTDVRPWWSSGDGKYRMDEKEFMGPLADNKMKNNYQFATKPFSTEEGKLFVPLENSPVIDEAVLIKGINDNYTGEAPDLGAYEYGQEAWVPGVNWTPSGFAWTPSTDYLSLGSIDKKNSEPKK